jgi:hypothetical protein
MSDTPGLVARVEALEKAVHSLLGAVNLLEELFEKSGKSGGGGKTKAGAGAKKAAGGAATKKHAPAKKRVGKR